jgi:hypothetical protein
VEAIFRLLGVWPNYLLDPNYESTIEALFCLNMPDFILGPLFIMALIASLEVYVYNLMLIMS